MSTKSPYLKTLPDGVPQFVEALVGDRARRFQLLREHRDPALFDGPGEVLQARVEFVRPAQLARALLVAVPQRCDAGRMFRVTLRVLTVMVQPLLNCLAVTRSVVAT